MCSRQLRDPRWYNDIDEADPKARDDASHDEHVRVLGGGHQRSASRTEQRSNPNTGFAAIFVGYPATEEATEHGAKIVYRDEATVGEKESAFVEN